MMIITVAFQPAAYSQQNSLGTSWSFSGVGLTYERTVTEDAFAHIDIKMEMAETFLGKATHPGLSTAFTWNLVFAAFESRNGTPVRFFAGPGFTAGLSHDMSAPPGLFFGLKGRVGMKCIYDRKINISVSLSPVLGIYMTEKNENILTRIYRHGLLQAILPEIGLSYRF